MHGIKEVLAIERISYIRKAQLIAQLLEDIDDMTPQEEQIRAIIIDSKSIEEIVEKVEWLKIYYSRFHS